MSVYNRISLIYYFLNFLKEIIVKKFHENSIFKNSIKINHNFSKNMITALGGNNTQYIYNIEDSLHKKLFAGLVEYEDLRQLHNKNNHMLGCLLPSCDSAYYELMPDRLIWTLDRKTTHTSLIEFIQNILNIRLYPRNRCSLWGNTGHN